MKKEQIEKSYRYCSGIACPIRNTCKRYLPDPPDIRLTWAPPAYNPVRNKCTNHDPTNTAE